MSLADDDDFAKVLLDHTTKIVGDAVQSIRAEINRERLKLNRVQNELTEVTKQNYELTQSFQNELAELKKQNEELTKTVQNVEEQLATRPQCSCNVSEKLTKAFSAAITAVNIDDISGPTSAAATMGNMMPVIATTSTPTQSISVPLRSTTQPTNRLSRKRKAPCTISAPGIATYLEDLQPDIRVAITPFYKPNKRASNDLLNDVQRAFVKYAINRAMKSGDSISVLLARQIIHEGIENYIWAEDFNPSEAEDFEKYILTRLKNEKKTARRSVMMLTQKQIVQNFLSDVAAQEGDRQGGERQEGDMQGDDEQGGDAQGRDECDEGEQDDM